MELIPKAKGGLSFNQAFAQARKAGLKTFKWRGGTYGTQLASEVNLPQMISMDSVQMPGFNPIDAPLRYVQSYSVNYKPTINNDPYRAQMIYDASKPVAGSAGRDVRQTGNVTVGTSSGNRNELRSRGRKAFTSKRQKNKQSTGKTDTSNK